MMLLICVGTDVLPAISLAYEEPELDIMTRKPRERTEHLVTTKVITHGYLVNGIIATAGCFIPYFIILWYYGFEISGLFYI